MSKEPTNCNATTPDKSMDESVINATMNGQGKRLGEFGTDASFGVTDNAPYRALPDYRMIMPDILDDDFDYDEPFNSQGS